MSTISPNPSGNTNSATLLGESCPKCGSDEAWHPVVTEPGENERSACDECGMWLSLKVTHPAAPKAPKARRPFGFSVEVSDGTLWVDWRGGAVLSFRPGWFLTVGTLNVISGREEDRLQEMWTKDGLEVGRRQAEEAMAS